MSLLCSSSLFFSLHSSHFIHNPSQGDNVFDTHVLPSSAHRHQQAYASQGNEQRNERYRATDRIEQNRMSRYSSIGEREREREREREHSSSSNRYKCIFIKVFLQYSIYIYIYMNMRLRRDVALPTSPLLFSFLFIWCGLLRRAFLSMSVFNIILLF